MASSRNPFDDIPYDNQYNPFDDIPNLKDQVETFKKYTGAERTPLSAIQNLLAGVATGGQNIATFAGAPPSYPVSEETFRITPETRQPLLQGIGQYGPLLAATGGGLLAGSGALPAVGRIAASGLYGASQEPESRISGAVTGGALQGVGEVGAPIVRAVGKSIPLTAKSISNFIQKQHDTLENFSKGLFKNVETAAENRGVNNVQINSDLITQAKDFFPDTTAANKLIDKAKTGNYKDLRKLQSDLWKRGTKFKSSDLVQEQDKGEEALDLRDKINESIKSHFINQGHNDLANTLDNAMSNYRFLKENYYNKNLPIQLRKLVNPELREVPKNIIKVLSKDSKPINEFLNLHPPLKDSIKIIGRAKKAVGATVALGTTGITAEGLRYLYNLIP